MTEARTAEWHDLRRQGIGASDWPAICGMSSFATPVDVWEQKVGLASPSEDNPQMEWGRRLEPVIADAFADRTGMAVRRRSKEVRYREWPVLFAHLDRTTIAGPLECKSSMSTRGWGEDGSADIPPHVALQVQAQLLCANKPRGFVAALLGYRDFRVYEIARDDDLINGSVLPILRDFWQRVETKTPPEPDGSESYGAFLRRLHPSAGSDERPATPEEQLLVGKLIAARRIREQAEREEQELVQRAQAAIADAGGLLGPGWRVSWRHTKPVTRTEWKLVAQSLGKVVDPETVETITGLYTETRPGSRPFRLTVEEEQE